MIIFPNEPAYFIPNQLDRLLAFASQHRASDITVQSGEPIFAEIEGRQIRLVQRRLTLQEVSDLINYIYGPNATAMIFSGTDIDTSYRVKVSEAEQYRFRVNITACYFDGYQGLQITLRAISSEPPPLAAMDLPDEIRRHMGFPQGIMVVSGATGSGKSTLLAAIIADLARKEDSNLKILTYESPIEYVYDKVKKTSCIISQTEIPRYLPNFAAGVRNALRRKPGLILVGEARDQETIEAVIDAALTGHPVYTTVHSNGVADTMRRMVTIFPAVERDARMSDLLETTKLVIWQALIPGVDGKRLPIREYLVIDNVLRDKLLDAKPDQLVTKIRTLIPEHGRTLAQDVEEKFKAGRIDEAVYQRFVSLRGGSL